MLLNTFFFINYFIYELFVNIFSKNTKKSEKKVIKMFNDILENVSLPYSFFDNYNQNSINSTVRNPLIYSINSCLTKVVEILIQKGADVNLVIKDNTPLYHALQIQHLNIIKILINNGAEVNRLNKNGETYLHELSIISKYDNIILNLLINKGINIDQQNEDGATALHLAAYHGNLKFVKFLIKNGANILLKTQKKKTAFDLAHQQSEFNNAEHFEIMHILMSFKPLQLKEPKCKKVKEHSNFIIISHNTVFYKKV